MSDYMSQKMDDQIEGAISENEQLMLENAELSAQLAISEHMYQSVCHFEDRCKELSAQVAGLVGALRTISRDSHKYSAWWAANLADEAIAKVGKP